MLVKTNKMLKLGSYIYLVCPVIIFTLGYLKWYFAIPIGIITFYAFLKALKADEGSEIVAEKNILLSSLIIIIFWVLLSGIGGCSFQNADHGARNAIFRALVEQSWPVKSQDQTRGLIYYIGFWMPSAVIGKLLGFEAGYKFQVIWSVIGIFVTYCLICVFRKKFDLLPIIFLIGFSGLDYLGLWFLGGEGTNLKDAAHIEWWAINHQYSSNTTQLFWVFNQAIPAWVATMLILNQKSCKNIFFILSTIMLTSTIPFVGLIPFAVFLVISKCVKNKSCWKEVFTIQNMVGVFVIGILMLLYLIGNTSGKMIGRDNGTAGNAPISFAQLIDKIIPVLCMLGIVVLVILILYFIILRCVKNKEKFKEVFSVKNISSFIVVTVLMIICFKTIVLDGMIVESSEGVYEPTARLIEYLTFCLFEFGIYCFFVYKYNKNNMLFYVLLVVLSLCPFVKVGSAHDFCMRASIPALLILLIFCMDTWEKLSKEKTKKMYIIFSILLCIGAITPFNEIHRSVRETCIRASQGVTVEYPEIESTALLSGDNFSGECGNNIFYKYLAK